MKSPEMNSPRAVDEEAAVGVAVPGDADVGLLRDHPLDDVAAVLFDERIGFVIRKAAVDLEAQPRRPAGQPIEQLRRDQPAHAAAGVEHDVERLDDRRIDERHHVLDVRRRARPSCVTLPRRAAGGGSVPVGDHVADVGDALPRRSAETPRWRTIFMPLYCFGIVRRRDLHAAVVAVARDGEVEHVGRDHAVVHDVGALRRRAVDERGRQRRRRQPHVAADRDPLRLQIGDERRADGARGVFVDLGRDTAPRTS